MQQNPFCPDAPEEPAPGKIALVVWTQQRLWNAKKHRTVSFQQKVQTNWATKWKKLKKKRKRFHIVKEENL